MKKISMTLIMMLVVLTSCSKEEIITYEYTFRGEGEYWKATFITAGTQIWGDEKGQLTYDHEDNEEFMLEYIGETNEISQIKTLEYSYKTSSGGHNSRRTFTEPPTEKIFTSSSSSKGGAKVQENEIIQVNVKWDQFEEEFELINENN
ncbi:hypothetical protein [Cytobacillus sp. IB215665]|uniref:hypothetical protein n=1 Tax=Cytobacillus sp. IB215665 TaxID=3097357 RepID=UPI002A15051D|nr:hypothetical protein [Cytobacillus sp. IB215665]MDX8365543.1 hypothetical protein [Cytobacillus sp. IB215665]